MNKKKSLERNVKLFPLYRAFSYDFLFLWTISILYLTQVKGMSYSQALYLDSIFMVAAFTLQIFITKLIKKIGNVNAIKLSVIAWILFVIIYIFCDNFIWFVLANVLYGLGCSIRNIADIQLLSNSLKKLDREKEFAKLEGRGSFFYYIFEGVSSIASGYLFSYVSPYAPLICCMVCVIILFVLSCCLVEPSKIKNDREDVIVIEEPHKKFDKEHYKKLHISQDTIIKNNYIKTGKREYTYKELLSNKFIITMMVFCFCFYGIMSVYSSLAKVYYQDINTPAWAFGYIFFGFKLILALSSKYQFKYDLKFGVRSLIIFAVLNVISFTVNGITAMFIPTTVVGICIITVMFIVQNIIRSPYKIFVKNYINICSNQESLPKVLTLYNMAEYVGYALVTTLVGTIMNYCNFAWTNIILVSSLAIPMLISVVLFIKQLITRFTKRYTFVRDDLKD